ncbi:MAG: Na+/H+ antiporter subunit E [Firmicutes bacterium]|nr:Na+/H+ antiporter subunit E [Bacillota bacterium]
MIWRRIPLKKATVPAIVSTALVCFIFWLLITGQVASLLRGEPSAQVLIAGVIVSLAAALFSARFFIHEKPFFFANPARLGKLIAYCFCIFPIELIKANVDVARRALSPSLPVNPGIVKVPVEVKGEYAQAMLADSITLTPGTITMETVEEDGQDYYYIHWIDVASQDGAEAGEAIKGTLEKWVRRIWE